MAKNIVPQTFILAVICLSSIECAPNYWDVRENIIETENSVNLGGRLAFEDGESRVNDILMKKKTAEITEGFAAPLSFAPARNFLEAKRDIDKSEVYRFIRRVPKGAVLHVHDKAMSSGEYFFNNVTHRENLYVCENGGKNQSTLVIRFFNEPDESCEWKLVSELRKAPETRKRINDKIRGAMSLSNGSLSTPNYRDGNEAWNKFNDVFKFVKYPLIYRPVFEDNYYRGLQELYDDNVIYAEVRTPLTRVYDLDGKKYTPIEIVRLYQDITDRFVREHPNFIGAKIIYSAKKNTNSQKFDTFLRTAAELGREFPHFFAGIDLVGQEDRSRPIKQWVDQIRTADRHMKFFFHAGETNWDGLIVDENLVDAVLLNSTRIGHGYALPKHPKIMGMVKEKKIAIEICPISNQVLGLVKDMRNHPGAELFVEGVPVVVSNDDPGLWGAKALSYDFYEAFMGIMSARADLRALKQLAMNSLEYSSLNATEKERAMSIWRRQWGQFLKSFNNETAPREL